MSSNPNKIDDVEYGALVIILVLNLLFWLIVIIWRFCHLRKLNAVIERRRAEMRGRINDGLDSEQQRGPEDDIYALSRGDFPPSYDDAIKSHPIFPPEPTTFPFPPQPPSTQLSADVSVRPRISVDAVATATSSTTENSHRLSEVVREPDRDAADDDVAASQGPSARIQISNTSGPPPLPKSPPPIE